MTGQGMFYIAFGIAACLAGYSMFRSMIPLWGFMIGGWIAFIMLPSVVSGPQSGQVLYQIGAFIIGGAIGAVLAYPLYYVIVFLSGGALGMLMGILVGALIDVGGISSIRQLNEFAGMTFPPTPQTGTQFVMMVIFGLILGGLAIGFQKFMIIASSSFLGSAAIITGLVGPITQIASSGSGKGAIMLIGFLILGFIGVFIQFRTMDET